MYDIDGNGYIDLDEMTEIIKSIYNMMGPNHEYIDEFASPETCAQEMFCSLWFPLSKWGWI